MRPFKITIRTHGPDNSFTLITNSGMSGFTVDWGDGTKKEHVCGGVDNHWTHEYNEPGEYQISITSEYFQIKQSHNIDCQKILSVDQWGDITWKNMRSMFYGLDNLTIEADDTPHLEQVEDMTGMFARTENFNHDISDWDLSNVRDISAMFWGAKSFNQDISEWDVSNVKDMSGVFYEAEVFNKDLNEWDVSNVRNMCYMFKEAEVFDQDLNDWDVSSVDSMTRMFMDTCSFNGDISNWDVSNVENMGGMFEKAKSFNQDLSKWRISSGCNTKNMFKEAVEIEHKNVPKTVIIREI